MARKIKLSQNSYESDFLGDTDEESKSPEESQYNSDDDSEYSSGTESEFTYDEENQAGENYDDKDQRDEGSDDDDWLYDEKRRYKKEKKEAQLYRIKTKDQDKQLDQIVEYCQGITNFLEGRKEPEVFR